MGKITKRDICRGYLDRKSLKGLPTLTLAKKIYGENIEEFINLESVRSCLRYLRGASGQKRRDHVERLKEDKGYAKDNPNNLNPFPLLPKPIKHFENWGHFQVEDSEKMLCLYDVHVPFHDQEALEVALSHAEEEGVDCILLAGDTADFFSISFHEKNPKMRDFAGEIVLVRQFLEHLRGRFPDARIIYKWGNHEVRMNRYYTVKAPELLFVDDFQFKSIMRLDELGIELIDDMRLVQFQDYVLCHGHEFFGGGGGAYPAKSYFMKAKTNIISGHLHRISEYSEQDLFGNIKRAYSSGCLCSKNQDYAQINFWQHGFVIMHKGKKGKAKVDNLLIVDGEIV